SASSPSRRRARQYRTATSRWRSGSTTAGSRRRTRPPGTRAWIYLRPATDSHHGEKMFRKVLVANRGEIARRVMRTCKRLGIATVAVYSDADESAPHVRDADESVRIGPAQVKESYLNAQAIVDAAKSTGAEAIHPGYGLLSEKATFAKLVADAGIVFVGPPVAALEACGDKMKARHVALAVNVPPVPG